MGKYTVCPMDDMGSSYSTFTPGKIAKEFDGKKQHLPTSNIDQPHRPVKQKC